MIEIPIYELNPIHLIIVASLFTITLLALMVDRHLEERRNKDVLDKINGDIKID